MNDLRITLMQSELVWESPETNMLRFSEKFELLKNKTDLVILPEMFTTGFSMTPQHVAETWPGKTLEWMKKESMRFDFAICGSIMTEEKGEYYNRFIWAAPDGTLKYYDKRHLFRMGGETNVYSPGEEHLIIKYKEWRIAPFICYDLRFPVWNRNKNHYDLAVYVANWPAVRYKVWEKLLMARAIENQCYVAGVNRVGVDGRELAYSGNSMVINARGEIDFALTPGIDEYKTINLSLSALQQFREKFPVFADADNFEIKL